MLLAFYNVHNRINIILLNIKELVITNNCLKGSYWVIGGLWYVNIWGILLQCRMLHYLHTVQINRSEVNIYMIWQNRPVCTNCYGEQLMSIAVSLYVCFEWHILQKRHSKRAVLKDQLLVR